VIVERAAGKTFLARSQEIAGFVGRIAREEAFDLIEFQDFDGIAFWALAHRAELGLTTTPIAVRFHGPADLMFESIGSIPAEIEVAASMEREAYRMADAVIVPSAAIADLVRDRYGLEQERISIGQPPIPAVGALGYAPPLDPEVVCFGRLGEVKGSHDFLDAALHLFDRHPDVLIRFIGNDGWGAMADRPMREWLRDMVPSDVHDRVVFEDSVAREALPEALSSASIVVIPSRFESFNLAAHELRAMGVPLVVRDLPAFRGFFDESTGVVTYDGSTDQLAQVLGQLLDDPARLARLATAPLPRYADPLAVYRPGFVTPRHSRAQAGLGTAAVKRLEDHPSDEPSVSPARKTAGALLRVLPSPLAKLAVRLLPQVLKDRFRSYADWNAEAARRREEDDRRRLQVRIATGAFPELDNPAVSFVIPCFNQGRFLEDALCSVFFQTFTSFDVVIVDDGSDDAETLEILDRLDWPRTQLIHQENRGLPGARNTGIREARGTYVVPLDADDGVAPEFLAKLVDALEQNPEAAFAQCYAELFGDQHGVWVSRPFNPYQLMLSNSVVGCVVLRKAAWEEVGGYDETLTSGNEDWDLWLRLTEAGWEQALVAEPLFRYRKHGLSMSVGTEARFERQRRDVAARHLELYGRIGEVKQHFYPLVSVILPDAAARATLDSQTLDDFEVVSSDPAVDGGRLVEGGVEACIAAARGKYVTVWDPAGEVASTLLEDLARALESAPEAAAAGTEQTRPLLWRSWTLFDPNAPHSEVLEVDVAPVGIAVSPLLAPGRYPRPGWFVPEHIEKSGLPIFRQPPEEEGFLPDWIAES
jgi:glycosyltransferase involved in cell wall biosynthesis/GT2 family glycosyltransferase